MSSHSPLVDALSVKILPTPKDVAITAADLVEAYLLSVLEKRRTARILLATGQSQIDFLTLFTASKQLDWSRLIFFHLDEYLGIMPSHPGSFHYYLYHRVDKAVHPGKFHYLQGDAIDPIAECDRYETLLNADPIDLVMLGVGANGHLGFNEPNVANLQDPKGVKLVKLAASTRQAQVDQGYFKNIDSAPDYAFTLTIPMICSGKKLVCLASGKAKAMIVERLLCETVSSDCPATVMRHHPDATLLIDQEAGSCLSSSCLSNE